MWEWRQTGRNAWLATSPRAVAEREAEREAVQRLREAMRPAAPGEYAGVMALDQAVLGVSFSRLRITP